MNETNAIMTGEQFSLGLIISIIQDVLKRWYLIVAAALIASMVAFMLTDFFYKPQYKTTTTFVATAGDTSTTTYANLTAAKDLAAVFQEVLNSSILKENVLAEVGISSFNGTIEAKIVNETNLLTMTVTGSDPRTVFQMTQAIIDNHHIVTDGILGHDVLEVLQNPSVPTKAINSPNTMKRVKQAGLLAFIAVTGLLAVLSFLSDKIRSKEEADLKLSCHVLGELYHERKWKSLKDLFSRQKKSILITNPLTSFIYAESIHKLSSRVEKRRHKGEHIIMVTSLLENEGKSTVAVNLALSMAKKGRKVLLIDGDMRKPACHLILGESNKHLGVADVLHGAATVQEAVQNLEHSDLYLMTTKKSQKTAANLIGSSAMAAMMKEAAAEFDFVVVDTPPMFMAPDAENISEFVDATLLVVRQNNAFADDLEDAISILNKSNAHLLGCVLNNVRGANHFAPAFSYGGYGYGRYSKYGKYGRYGKYGKYGYGRGKTSNGEEKA